MWENENRARLELSLGLRFGSTNQSAGFSSSQHHFAIHPVTKFKIKLEISKFFTRVNFRNFLKLQIWKETFFCKIWARFFALEIKCTVHSVVGQDTAAAVAEVNKINNIISRKFSFYLLLFYNFEPILRRKKYEKFNAPGEFEIYFAIRGLPNRGISAFSFF